ncbi:MAG: biotin--[acetyl-CoA-carboxylase] ligase [Nitrospiraceae bacterium]|nr:biotin--[acetyl-CoA-carboxylase] ligase [Nitrospiraceae bacterium]
MIIKMLQKTEGFISGEEMSKKLGITRAAVWKKIRTLRAKGYKIKGSTAKGYKLTESPDFSVEELSGIIKGTFGAQIVYFESIDSTNNKAMELAEKGLGHGAVLIADTQLKGKGRLGRTWISPPKGNIYMSVILKPEIQPKDGTLLTIMAAIACAKAVRSLTSKHSEELQVKIKWPNDLMLLNKKFGGILTEMRLDPDRIVTAVIGIGINVNIIPDSLPADVKAAATSLKEHLEKPLSRTQIIAEILKGMEYWHEKLIKQGRQPLLEEWKKLSSTLGRKVRVSAGNETFTGIAEDIDDEGMLLLRLPSNTIKRINAGDLTFLI